MREKKEYLMKCTYVEKERETERAKERKRKSEKGCHGNHKNTANQKIVEFQ